MLDLDQQVLQVIKDHLVLDNSSLIINNLQHNNSNKFNRILKPIKCKINSSIISNKLIILNNKIELNIQNVSISVFD